MAWETLRPSMRSSPWIRGAPQRKFSRAIRAIRSRTSLETLGRPPRQRPRDRLCPKCRPALTAPTQDRIGLNDHQAFTPTWPPARRQNPNQSINATEARASGFRYAPARQSDGAARSLPATARCGSGVRFRRPGSLRLAALPSTQAIARHSKSPMNSRELSSEEAQEARAAWSIPRSS